MKVTNQILEDVYTVYVNKIKKVLDESLKDTPKNIVTKLKIIDILNNMNKEYDQLLDAYLNLESTINEY